MNDYINEISLDHKLILALYQLPTERVETNLLPRQPTKTKTTNRRLLQLMSSTLQVTLVLPQNIEQLLFLLLYLPLLTVLLNQLLYRFTRHSKLQRKVVLSRQHLYYLAESQANLQNVMENDDKGLGFGERGEVAEVVLENELQLWLLLGEQLQVVFQRLRVDVVIQFQELSVPKLEKRGKDHRIYQQLFAVDAFLQPLNDFLILSFPCQRFLYFQGVGLPAELLAFFDDDGYLLSIDVVEQFPDLVSLGQSLFVVVVFFEGFAVDFSEFLDLFEEGYVLFQVLGVLVQVEIFENGLQVVVEIIVAFIPTCVIVLQELITALHLICVE